MDRLLYVRTSEGDWNPLSFDCATLSRVGADRADSVRTDVDAAIAGRAPVALLLRVDNRSQVLVIDAAGGADPAADFAEKPPAGGVPRPGWTTAEHIWAARRVGAAYRRPGPGHRAAPRRFEDAPAHSWWPMRWPCWNWHDNSRFSPVDGSPTRSIRAWLGPA